MNNTFLWRKYSRKTLWLIISLMLYFPALNGQDLVAAGVLPSIEYVFTGPKKHVEFPTMVHALAYSQKKEAGKVKATKTITVHYKIIRIPNKGFETILTLHTQPPTGDLSFYHFYNPQMILPALESFNLIMKNGKEFIYLKNAQVDDSGQDTFYFKFKHQRYALNWELSINNIHWKPYIDDEEFKDLWSKMNDYQSAVFLLQEETKLETPKHPTSQLINKLRWLALYDQMEQQGFYQYLIIKQQHDPDNLKRNLEIRKYILTKEIEQLRNNNGKNKSTINIEDFTKAYLKPDFDLNEISQKDMSIYSAMYFNFDPKSESTFCLSELEKIFSKSKEDRKKFEFIYQKKSIERIDDYIAQKLPKEALYQIEKFDAFYDYAIYLKKSATFNRYKSKAVYEIYLSYIQVAKQALEKNRIDMAMRYLDQATLVQQKYPSEIINDIYVEKELRNLVKKALERYKELLDSGDHENAKQVKDGILGLMKKIGMSNIDS